MKGLHNTINECTHEFFIKMIFKYLLTFKIWLQHSEYLQKWFILLEELEIDANKRTNCNMINKNPEAEGQKSKPACHWLLPLPQSKTAILILDWGRGNSQWLNLLLCWPSYWISISVSGFLLNVLQQTVKVFLKRQNTNPI